MVKNRYSGLTGIILDSKEEIFIYGIGAYCAFLLSGILIDYELIGYIGLDLSVADLDTVGIGINAIFDMSLVISVGIVMSALADKKYSTKYSTFSCKNISNNSSKLSHGGENFKPILLFILIIFGVCISNFGFIKGTIYSKFFGCGDVCSFLRLLSVSTLETLGIMFCLIVSESIRLIKYKLSVSSDYLTTKTYAYFDELQYVANKDLKLLCAKRKPMPQINKTINCFDMNDEKQTDFIKGWFTNVEFIAVFVGMGMIVMAILMYCQKIRSPFYWQFFTPVNICMMREDIYSEKILEALLLRRTENGIYLKVNVCCGSICPRLNDEYSIAIYDGAPFIKIEPEHLIKDSSGVTSMYINEYDYGIIKQSLSGCGLHYFMGRCYL